MLLSPVSLKVLLKFFTASLKLDEGNALKLFDYELNDFASDCSTLQVAAYFAKMNNLGISADGGLTAHGLLSDVERRKSDKNWFSIPYNVILGGRGLVDLAEFGAAAYSVTFLAENTSKVLGTNVLESMAANISEFESPDRIGAYIKNESASLFDVLNGDMYAALVLGSAYRTTGRASYCHQLVATVRHLMDRFDASTSQWAYSERWDGEALLGMSVAYQATITGWGRSLTRYLPRPLAVEWSHILTAAEVETSRQIELGRSVSNEAPTWVSPWENVWEIWQSFALQEQSTVGELWVQQRIGSLERGIAASGIDHLIDSRPTRAERTVIGSRLRGAANLVAILMNVDQNISGSTESSVARALSMP